MESLYVKGVKYTPEESDPNFSDLWRIWKCCGEEGIFLLSLSSSSNLPDSFHRRIKKDVYMNNKYDSCTF